MKRACCDTSFLFALYCRDTHTDRARALMRPRLRPLILSVLNQFELENALRFVGWSKRFSVPQVDSFLAAFAADLEAGRLVIVPCDLAQIISEARRLSGARTMTSGHRAFDILHVATAIYLGADEFLSFDSHQRRLARAEGLKLNP